METGLESIPSNVYISLIVNNQDPIFILDPNGNIVSANWAIMDVFGYSIAEMTGRNFRDVLPITIDFGLVCKVSEGAYSSYQVSSFSKTGRTIHLEVKTIPLEENGKLVNMLLITKDVTDLMETKARLEQFKKLLNASPEPNFVLNEGVIRYINKAAVKTFGYQEPAELLGMHILKLIPSDSLEFIADIIQRSELDLTIPEQTVDQKMKRKDGTSFITESILLGIEYENKPAVHVIFRDITEKKIIEEALRNSEEKYRLITEHMTDFVTVIDEQGIITYASPSSYPVLGYSPDDYEGTPVSCKVHPDDYPSVQEQARNLFQLKHSCEMEFRYMHRTNDWIWVEAIGTYFEEKGKGYLLFVSRVIEEKKSIREKLTSMAFHDELTGLPNRRLFRERMSETLEEAKRNYSKCAVLFMDIDKFKWVNDHLGHSVGDMLLKQFANRVNNGILRENDIFARQGGDEFLVLLPDIESEENAIGMAKRILDCLQEKWRVGDEEFTATSSIGIAVFPKDGTSIDELLTNADSALYRAKENGRNNYMMYS
ncbi:sensor domain-containing protein [Sporosarcina highlanderae]|uniref:PAS domain S-box protein n=1 Tax=Sporosarcina highlanderae TaxID=3035916 RepID=A0ABT8JRC6_9BACL|nr:PAS domain S-box protein [Sporosarcina highlanderae]MDN4607705.1 PAS domain S-box protein [Sporosarcina highlanderae]